MAPLFSPAGAVAGRKAAKQAARKTPVQPSQFNRAKARPAKTVGDASTVESYRRAIACGCKKAGIPGWHPHQLRHSAATQIRREFGLDVARAVQGHSPPAVTAIYAEQDLSKAAKAMGRVANRRSGPVRPRVPGLAWARAWSKLDSSGSPCASPWVERASTWRAAAAP